MRRTFLSELEGVFLLAEDACDQDPDTAAECRQGLREIKAELFEYLRSYKRLLKARH